MSSLKELSDNLFDMVVLYTKATGVNISYCRHTDDRTSVKRITVEINIDNHNQAVVGEAWKTKQFFRSLMGVLELHAKSRQQDAYTILHDSAMDYGDDIKDIKSERWSNETTVIKDGNFELVVSLNHGHY